MAGLVCSSHPGSPHSYAEVLAVQCSGSSALELSLKDEQLILRTAWARAIKAMVDQFLSELKKASVGHCALPGFPRLGSLGQDPWYSWVRDGRTPRQAAAHPPACRTLAMPSPCAATSPMTTASSVSTVGTSLGYCQWLLRSQVFPGLAEGDCQGTEGQGR